MTGIHYAAENDGFYATLKARVDSHFKTHGKNTFATPKFYVKALVLIACYVSCYIAILNYSEPLLVLSGFAGLGVLAILLGINVAHDAAHASISRKQWINRLFIYVFDLLGANSYIWQLRHVNSHHIHPNVMDYDADLKQNPLVRIFPQSKRYAIHKAQFIYTPLLYLIYTINWLFFRDFQDFSKHRIGSLELHQHPVKEKVRLVLFKAVYIAYIVIIPFLFAKTSMNLVLLGLLLMHCFAGITISLALIPSHVAEDSHFFAVDEHGMLPHSWSHHQVLSVTDFATSNTLLNTLFGGFNHHLTHHLFPNINHIHYPEITPIVAETVREFGLTYKHQHSFLQAYLSHFRLLKNNGKVQIQEA